MSEAAQVCDACGSDIDWDARRSVSERIGSLEVGDFFHARGITRGGLICLVVDVTQTSIIARQVPSAAFVCRFDRTTGDRLPDGSYTVGDDGPCRIDSVEPLPGSVHTRMLDMDRRARLRPFENRLPEQPRNWKAMLLASEHYAAHHFDSVAAGEGTK